jgi:hypothetical protein
MLSDEVGGVHERRRKVDEPSWNGLAQSRPKLGDCCMEVHVDMCGGVMIKVEVV